MSWLTFLTRHSPKPAAEAIWQAVRIACSSWLRRISRCLGNGLALAFREQAAHGRYLAHLDGVAVETGEDAVQAEQLAVVDQQGPAVEVAAVRLAGYAAAEPLNVALDVRAPSLQADCGQADGEPAVGRWARATSTQEPWRYVA
jgi:hypothetical protein